MQQVMTGEATPTQLAGFLVALRAKGETVDEIVGFRDAILDNATPLLLSAPMSLDIVGTGGDRFKTVNISTMSPRSSRQRRARRWSSTATGRPALRRARAMCSAALGVDLTRSPERVAEVLDEVGLTFVFAAAFHPGFRQRGVVRGELGVPTVFNFLGPLCNPARPEANAVGVARLEAVELIVGVFQTRGATALVFRGDDGLDELSTTGHSHIWEVSSGAVTEHDMDPRDLGLPRAQHRRSAGRQRSGQCRHRPPRAVGGFRSGSRHRAAQYGRRARGMGPVA